MVETIYAPKWGMTMSEAHIGRWLKNVGDRVSAGDELVEIESEKITNTLTSPVDGILSEILVQSEQDVPVGTELAKITSVA